MPKHLVVIGAGIIGLELGSVWRRLGAEVTVVEFLDRITPGDGRRGRQAFQRSLTKQGMKFKLGAKVTGAKASDKGVELTFEPVDGGAAETIDADYVLLAIGRRPYTEGLGLESVGITPDKRGFIETDHYKTGVAGVWAIGDVTSRPDAGPQGRGRGGRLHRADRRQGRPRELRRHPRRHLHLSRRSPGSARPRRS